VNAKSDHSNHDICMYASEDHSREYAIILHYEHLAFVDACFLSSANFLDDMSGVLDLKLEICQFHEKVCYSSPGSPLKSKTSLVFYQFIKALQIIKSHFRSYILNLIRLILTVSDAGPSPSPCVSQIIFFIRKGISSSKKPFAIEDLHGGNEIESVN